MVLRKKLKKMHPVFSYNFDRGFRFFYLNAYNLGYFADKEE